MIIRRNRVPLIHVLFSEVRKLELCSTCRTDHFISLANTPLPSASNVLILIFYTPVWYKNDESTISLTDDQLYLRFKVNRDSSYANPRSAEPSKLFNGINYFPPISTSPKPIILPRTTSSPSTPGPLIPTNKPSDGNVSTNNNDNTIPISSHRTFVIVLSVQAVIVLLIFTILIVRYLNNRRSSILSSVGDTHLGGSSLDHVSSISAAGNIPSVSYSHSKSDLSKICMDTSPK